MPESRHEVGGGLIANRFKPIRPLRPNVLHARDGRRHVAIEMVPAADHDLVELRRRIALANTIDHPNLCRPREVVEHGDLLVLVTELVEGVSIADRLMVGPFDPLQVGALMVDLLSVLTRIHGEGLPHGSISPSTVILDAHGALRLMDLGVHRTSQLPTPRGDLEAVGALAKTMVAGYLGSAPSQLLGWIARCGDHARPFVDARAAAAALVTPDVVSTEVRGRTPTLVGMSSSKRIPVRESSVAIKIPTLDEPAAKPLEVVPVEPLRRARAPSAMVRTSEALTLAASLQEATAVPEPAPAASPPDAASPPEVAAASPPDAAIATAPPDTIADPPERAPAKPASLDDATTTIAPAEPPPTEPVPVRAATARPVRPRRARGPLIAGGLAAAAALAVVGWWANAGSAESEPAKPSVVWVSEPIPAAPTLRGKPPLPTGAVVVPVDPVPVTIRLDQPTHRPAPVPAPAAAGKPMAVALSTESAVPPSTTLDVAFSAESAWIETPAVYVLEEAYRQLVRAPTARVEVVGHSSNDGEEARNTQLAIGRAIAVKRFLVDRGVEEGRIAIVAKDNEPVASNDRDALAKTRRAEIRILPPAP